MQTDLIGAKMAEFLSPEDGPEWVEAVAALGRKEGSQTRVLRAKSILTNRGRTLNLKGAAFKALKWSLVSASPDVVLALAEPLLGHLTAVQAQTLEALARPSAAFLTRHGPDMRFTYAQDEYTSLSVPFLHARQGGTGPGSWWGGMRNPSSAPASSNSSTRPTSPSSRPPLRSVRPMPPGTLTHKGWCLAVRAKGQSRSGLYRMLGSGERPGTWVQTEAVLLNNTARGLKSQVWHLP